MAIDMVFQIKSELKKYIKPEKVAIFANFFKTGQGQYGEGDLFLGINVPDQRTVAKLFQNEATLSDVDSLLKEKYHECRLTALLILVEKYKKSSDENKKRIVDFYLENLKRVNNWDLVDLTAPKILGNYLLDKDRKILYRLARSENLWEKRVSIISTYTLLKDKQYLETIEISKILLSDTHDLIHKAVGWMLREMGKMDKKIEMDFLDIYYKKMPRTMLRYAIEKFSEEERQDYLKR